MRNRIGLCLIGVVSCLILAAVWAVLAVSGTALAAPPDGKGKGGGDDSGPTAIWFDVLLGVDDRGTPLGNPDIFMVCDSGIEGVISNGAGQKGSDKLAVREFPTGFDPLMDITSVINQLDDTSCFDDLDPEKDGTFVVGRHALLRIVLADRAVNEVTVAISFRAKDTKGKIVGYRIDTIGTLVSGPNGDGGNKDDWAFAQDAVDDGTADQGTIDTIPNFFVEVEGGTGWALVKSDGSQKFACTGSGNFANGFGISITRPRLAPDNSQLPPCP